MPSALMTSAHFWVSSSISFSNSCGEVGLASRPVVCTYFCTALLLSAMRKALFSSSIFSLGVALGANMPYQLLACTFLMPSSSKVRSEEHTSELQSLMRISYAVFCLKKKKKQIKYTSYIYQMSNQIITNHHNTKISITTTDVL